MAMVSAQMVLESLYGMQTELYVKLRIFIGLTEVSGYYSRLQKGFNEIGVEAEFFPLQDHHFSYAPSSFAWAPYFAQVCVKRRIEAQKKSMFKKVYWLLMVAFSRTVFFLWAASRFDVFLMGGGSSFFRFRELGLLRLLGRRIIYTFHGTDSRPAWMDGFCNGTSRMEEKEIVADFPTKKDLIVIHRVNKERLDTVRRIEQHANIIINAPPQAQLHVRPYIISHAIGIPVEEITYELPKKHESSPVKIHILHCPSFHIGKGTAEIRSAISQLQKEGLSIEYLEISNSSNFEVRQAIAACDFVVDQVYSDSPMAGFAAEAASLGKPAVVCGYYSAFYKNDLPSTMRPPSLYCHPDALIDSIRLLALNIEERENIGVAAREYVKKNWSPQVVARHYLSLVNDEPIPESWFYNPVQNGYFLGMGMDECTIRKVIRGYLNLFGENALGIDTVPDLKNAVLKFATEKGPYDPVTKLHGTNRIGSKTDS